MDTSDEDSEKIIIAPSKTKLQKDTPDKSKEVSEQSQNIDLKNLELDSDDPQTADLIKRMRNSTPLERREIYGKLQEKSILKNFPKLDQLRKEGDNSFHALDGKNPINIRARKVKLIRDVGGEAIEVHFREYVDNAHHQIRVSKGFEEPDNIRKKKDLKKQGQYEED